MKKNDIALILLIVSVTLVVAFVTVKAVFGSPKSQTQQVERVEAIEPGIVQPSSSVFNSKAINPTVVIQIGNPANQQPFGQ